MNRLVVSWNQLKTKDLHYLKRAMYYGDGFFETIRWQKNEPLFWHHHWHRIEYTARVLSIPLPCSAPELLQAMQKELLPDVCHQRVRLSFIRTGEGYYTPQQSGLIIVAECSPLAHTGYAWNNEPCTTGLSSVVKLRHTLSSLKLLSAQTYVIAGIEAQQKGWHEAILLNDAGQVCEGISHNLFIVKNGIVSTPPLSEGCLQGIMRSYLLQFYPNIQERVIQPEELQEADELFFTNVITGIRPVTMFNHRTLKHELTTELFSALQQSLPV
jgi:branched-chain amino acid aminotransferase